VPNIRPEIPGYTLAPLVGQQLGLRAIGTFDDRRGDQRLLDRESTFEPAWGRLFGATADLGWERDIFQGNYSLGAGFDGSYWGLQTGLDLVGWEHDNGHVDRIGAFYSHADASGDVEGNVLGRTGIRTGKLDLDQDALGLYWTHTAPSGWYVDLVGLYGWLDGMASSRRGIGADLDGSSVAISIETGVSLPLNETWSIEPQAQLVWQRISLDNAHDPFTTIRYDDFDTVTGRIGARLKAETELGGAKFVSHLGVNLWHGFSSDGNVTFGSFPFAIETGGTSVEFNGGTSVDLNQSVSLYANLSYAFAVEETDRHSFGGQVGLRVKW
jgi:outer membrane autotransporter protein